MSNAMYSLLGSSACARIHELARHSWVADIKDPESHSPGHSLSHIIVVCYQGLDSHQAQAIMVCIVCCACSSKCNGCTEHGQHTWCVLYAGPALQNAMVYRAWTAYLVEVKQERARQEADQQQLAEQHHRQVLIRGLWEGLGQAIALRRTAQHDAHRHFQLCRQRLVSDLTETHGKRGSTSRP